MTFYLAPSDCHLIFAPADGKIWGSCHVPGKLFPVKQNYLEKIPGLFTLNERLITFMECHGGSLAVVKVGALNVGNISTEYDPNIGTNRRRQSLRNMLYQPAIPTGRGEHLGTFNLGSTVILLLQEGMARLEKDLAPRQVKYGERLGTFL